MEIDSRHLGYTHATKEEVDRGQSPLEVSKRHSQYLSK